MGTPMPGLLATIRWTPMTYGSQRARDTEMPNPRTSRPNPVVALKAGCPARTSGDESKVICVLPCICGSRVIRMGTSIPGLRATDCWTPVAFREDMAASTWNIRRAHRYTDLQEMNPLSRMPQPFPFMRTHIGSWRPSPDNPLGWTRRALHLPNTPRGHPGLNPNPPTTTFDKNGFTLAVDGHETIVINSIPCLADSALRSSTAAHHRHNASIRIAAPVHLHLPSPQLPLAPPPAHSSCPPSFLTRARDHAKYDLLERQATSVTVCLPRASPTPSPFSPPLGTIPSSGGGGGERRTEYVEPPSRNRGRRAPAMPPRAATADPRGDDSRRSMANRLFSDFCEEEISTDVNHPPGLPRSDIRSPHATKQQLRAVGFRLEADDCWRILGVLPTDGPSPSVEMPNGRV